MRSIIWWGMLSLFSGIANGAEAVATVAGEPITDQDIVHYARGQPLIAPYLSIPRGPMRILDNMIKERLLLLEGQRLGMPKPAEHEGGEVAYLAQIRKALVKPCPEATEEQVRAFYDAHPELFSTPLFLRLSRIGIQTKSGEAQAVAKLREIQGRIQRGELTFAAAATAHSEDPLGRERAGDIGFLPVEAGNAILDQLQQAKRDEIVGPVQEQGMAYLYQVTDRREPILEPYTTARTQAVQEQARDCRQRALDDVFTELKKRWPVAILVRDIGITPEPKNP